MRQIKLNAKETAATITDSLGGQWAVGVEENGAIVVLTELAKWRIFIEGSLVGDAFHSDPAEAAREVLAASGMQSLPEAVAVVSYPAVYAQGSEAFVIFTLGGEAFKVPLTQFQQEIEKSTRWIQARQAKRHEIDALMAELKKIGGK